MTTLYQPVLIESAEQAEALLPRDTEFVVTRTYDDPAEGTWAFAYGHDFPRSWFPFTALVPIEAEEEERVAPEALTRAAAQALARAEEAARTYALPPGRLTIQRQARLVTPWAPVAEPIEGEALADCGDRA